MTPSGVEQFIDNAGAHTLYGVAQTMTPSGVEQLLSWSFVGVMDQVAQTMTPSGVEQSSNPLDLR